MTTQVNPMPESSCRLTEISPRSRAVGRGLLFGWCVRELWEVPVLSIIAPLAIAAVVCSLLDRHSGPRPWRGRLNTATRGNRRPSDSPRA